MKTKLFNVGMVCLIFLGGCSSPEINDTKPRPKITITTDTNWAANGTYHISCDLYLKSFLVIGDSSTVIIDSTVTIYVETASGNAILSIGKGSTIKFGKGASIEVGYNNPGTFIAHGTPTDTIRFTRSSVGNQWGYEGTASDKNSGGIRIGYYAKPQTSFTFCVIEYATVGVNSIAPEMEISNCSIRNCAFEGLILGDSYYYSKGAGFKDSTTFNNNCITANGNYPLIIGANLVGQLSLSNNLKGNNKSGIFVRGNGIDSSSTWKKQFSPFVIDGEISVFNTLTILPGCRLEFTPSYNKYSSYYYSNISISSMGSRGKLIAQGTPIDSIVFTKTSNDSNWGDNYYNNGRGGINIESNSDGAIIKYCIIEYAPVGLVIGSTNTEISNTTIRHCIKDGIRFYSYSDYGSPHDSASFLNNVITQNGGYAFSINSRFVGGLSGTGDFSGNSQNGILVYGGSVDIPAVWKKHNVPYVISGCIDVGKDINATLTIRSGCRLEFLNDSSYIRVGYNNPGCLIAQGLPNDSIVFTKRSGAKWWGYSMGGIWFGKSAINSTVLQYCDISQATSGVYAESSVSIQNCRIHDNKYYAIDFAAAGLEGNVSNNTFSNNILGDIHQ